ncbi:PBSX family phage terminase large subunit [Anaerocolumna jejuensis]|uniref:PBSX family phage terminase large subunit n=1 Tax=Anaerocolumna jejuensis TaxID=259063 RepID=UPI003F7C7D5A
MPKKQKKATTFKFEPFSDQQKRLMNWWRIPLRTSENDFVIADGSIRSGKTIACICGFLQWSQEMFQGESFILAGKTMGALKKNVVKPMLQILEAWNWPYTYIRSGSDTHIEIGTNTYYLYGANTEASQDAMQGLTAAGAYADEAALFPQSLIDQMIGRCSVTGAKIWMNCNPEGPHHYINEEFIKKAKEKKLYRIHFMMIDNLTLSKAVIERYERAWEHGSVFYKRFILGSGLLLMV